jgi:hypothetical protein
MIYFLIPISLILLSLWKLEEYENNKLIEHIKYLEEKLAEN